MTEKYVQKKYWPTRRIHLYDIQNDGYALCGNAMVTATYENFPAFLWNQLNRLKRHPYDDLNFCQSCRRVAEKRAGNEYKPLTKHYEEIVTNFSKK